MSTPPAIRFLAALLLAASLPACTRAVHVPAAEAARVSPLRSSEGSIEVTTVSGKPDTVDADFTELEVRPRRGASVPDRLDFSAPFRVEADGDELVIVDIPRCRDRARRPACRPYVEAGRWSVPGAEEVTRIPMRDVHSVAIETSPTTGKTVAVVVVVGVLSALAVGGAALAVGMSSMDMNMGWR